MAKTRRPKAESLALATSMQRFDRKLTAAQVQKIALAIDGTAALGKSLNPKKKRLKNADEPAGPFAVEIS